MISRSIRRRVSSMAGVEKAAVAHVMPLDFGGSRTTVEIAGYVPRPDEDMELNFVRVTPAYFETLGIPLLQGRVFDDADRAGQGPRIIVNETMARRFWPNGDAVGRFVRFNPREPFDVEDLLTGARWTWSDHNFVMLDAFAEPVHILHVKGAR